MSIYHLLLASEGGQFRVIDDPCAKNLISMMLALTTIPLLLPPLSLSAKISEATLVFVGLWSVCHFFLIYWGWWSVCPFFAQRTERLLSLHLIMAVINDER